MNIFFLDDDVNKCAEYHVDKHVVKMILELGQLMCTALNHKAGSQITPYKTTHLNHPCSIWVRESLENFMFTYELMHALNREYKHRYGKDDHKTAVKLSGLDEIAKKFYDATKRTPFRLAMDDIYKVSADPIECYREYYRKGKTKLHVWSKRNPPDWL
jgi:GR25 family glycosyltransferase involved in LPS biosynthesis